MVELEKIDNLAVYSSESKGDHCVFKIVMSRAIDKKFADGVVKRFEEMAHRFVEEIRQEKIWLPRQ